ncbi:uncharacterized protein LOC107474136 [Arachis duranensis]|uniref:Uncharacterized protein LOC107474136 n=2 Tax=Arachis TaxID=3817 RepID=A0A6P5N237_ARADU|nr:uncharacterized protein LOC107474136 [Arachis duranensis]XP_020990915.1 uncharacterized protein LOC107474136 [Arachis duranensis]XP_029147706.1 uncharacterized protein LOC114925091 [Arachis hypogaea]XP_029147707.1 uncharacterized protein LOC114925091 [Arachis hypogaea]QHO53113.1 uncharacterized protein DS421_2g45040 [Arachis hypogaea]QHO53114.1 uncharacterized protein DS421_2g45040 [Arachis hypogaea]RYR73632.1 hypothetical protein Ahy_A02g008070 [Arachis hypogaea]
MSGEVVRVVKCPKCRKLLQEPTEYDIYKCGGCGTTLKAKKRRSVNVIEGSSTQKTDAAPRTSYLFSEDKQCGNRKQVAPQENGPKAKATSFSSGEYYMDKNVGRDQLQPFNLSNEELESELDSYKLTLRRRRVPNKTTCCEIEETECGNLASEGSKEFFYSPDKNDNSKKSASTGEMSEMKVTSDSEVDEEFNTGNSSPEGSENALTSGSDREQANNNNSTLIGSNTEMEVNGSDSGRLEELNNGSLLLGGEEDDNKNKSTTKDLKPQVEIKGIGSEEEKESSTENLLVKEAEDISGSDGEDGNNDKSAPAAASAEVAMIKSNLEEAEEINNGNLLRKEEFSLCVPSGDPNNERKALVGAKSEVATAESISTTKSSRTENVVSEKGTIFPGTPDKVDEGMSGNHVSSSELQKQAQKGIHHSFDRVRSVETLDTKMLVNPSPTLHSMVGAGFSKSATTRNTYVYDGIENTNTSPNSVSEETTRKGKGLVNPMSYGDLGTQHQSHLFNEKQHDMKGSRANQENKEMGTTTRHGHQHWMRTKRDELPSRMTFHRSSSQSHYERNRMSNQLHDDLYRNSRFLSPDSYEDTNQEKMKLLRMIHNLQDQLNRTHHVSRETKNGRLSTGVCYKEKHIPSHHNHDLHCRRFSRGVDYLRCNERCNHQVGCHQRHKLSQIPYSDEVTSSVHHIYHSCPECYPTKWHFPANLHPRALHHREELFRSYPGLDSYSPWHSYSSSLQWSTTSRLPVYGSETKSDTHKHRADKLRRYLREKEHMTKWKYRPVAGGAPFVTCRKCLNLLRLPEDFLHSKRGHCQLKCGECSEVFKFSPQNRKLASHSSNVLGPPSCDLSGRPTKCSQLHL